MRVHSSSVQSRQDQVDLEVRVVDTEAGLLEAAQVRLAGYGHHMGEEKDAFACVEALDRAQGTVVLLCRDKLSGRALGTARITPGDASHPLSIEHSVILPGHMSACRRAEVSRLAVLPGAPAMVKLCLMKAVYRYCMSHGVVWIVIAARNEALARNYRRLGFKDFLAPGQMASLACAGNMPHFVFTMAVQTMAAQWQHTGHRLQAFMLEAAHPALPNWSPARPASPRPAASVAAPAALAMA